MFNFVDVEYDNMEEPSVVERNGQRFYKFPSVDDYYPSVTTVTGIRSRESIAKWRARVGEEEANRVSARASSRGSQFHAILEEHIKGTLDEQKYQKHPLALNMFKMARKTLGRVDNIHALETPLYSHLFGLAGRVDCIAEFDKELAVIDFKTSTKEKRESYIENYFVQETAYAAMFYERTGIKVKKIVTLIATEEGSIQVFQKYNLDDYLQLLKSYKDEFNALQNQG
jgi:ATP-dependent exoDNAse (exonuclease V) beta subunit